MECLLWIGNSRLRLKPRMTANGTLLTYKVQNALVNLSIGQINIYMRIFKLELTAAGLTKQQLTSMVSLNVHQSVNYLHLTRHAVLLT
jgi:hypothetical protein